LTEKIRIGALDGGANQTLEQMSIFQNKELAHYRNVQMPQGFSD
jgi:hypothetical protein